MGSKSHAVPVFQSLLEEARRDLARARAKRSAESPNAEVPPGAEVTKRLEVILFQREPLRARSVNPFQPARVVSGEGPIASAPSRPQAFGVTREEAVMALAEAELELRLELSGKAARKHRSTHPRLDEAA